MKRRKIEFLLRNFVKMIRKPDKCYSNIISLGGY